MQRNTVTTKKKTPRPEHPLAQPRVERVMVSSGIGSLITKKGLDEETALKEATQIISTIAGQRPRIVRSRKSVSGFKLRQGMPVSVSVTLRGARAMQFLHRLVAYALPRDRNFAGLKPSSFDDRGNLNLGLVDATTFPEAMSDAIKHVYSIGITVVLSGKIKERKVQWCKTFGFPLRQQS